jgi:hypothetical protein
MCGGDGGGVGSLVTSVFIFVEAGAGRCSGRRDGLLWRPAASARIRTSGR